MKLPIAGLCLFMSSLAAVAGDLHLLEELPPPSYRGDAFVDANGCAFGRTEFEGMKVWVMRLDKRGRPLCGRKPTDLSSAVPPRLADAAKWRATGG